VFHAVLAAARDAIANPLLQRLARFGPPPAHGRGHVPTMHELKCNGAYARNGTLSAMVASFDNPCGAARSSAEASTAAGAPSADVEGSHAQPQPPTVSVGLFHHASTRDTLRLTPMFPAPQVEAAVNDAIAVEGR
jgi:hypothetical protein